MTRVPAHDKRFVEENILGLFRGDSMPFPVLIRVRFIPVKTSTGFERVLALGHTCSISLLYTGCKRPIAGSRAVLRRRDRRIRAVFRWKPLLLFRVRGGRLWRLEGRRDVLVNDDPVVAAPLENVGGPGDGFHHRAYFRLDLDRGGVDRPDNVPAARSLEIAEGEFDRLPRGGDLLETLLILRPSGIFQRRDIKEDQPRVLGVVRGDVFDVQGGPAGENLFDPGPEFRGDVLVLGNLGRRSGATREQQHQRAGQEVFHRPGVLRYPNATTFFRSCSRLFVPQGQQRIQAGGAARRQVTRRGADRQQSQGN